MFLALVNEMAIFYKNVKFVVIHCRNEKLCELFYNKRKDFFEALNCSDSSSASLEGYLPCSD